MKKIASLGLLVLIASMIFSNIPISVEAQADPSILLKIALKAKHLVEQRISTDASEEANRLFIQASNEIDLLTESLENGDISSARQHFLSAMQIFKKITQIASSERSTYEASRNSTPHPNLFSLERLEKHISNLKTIAQRQNVEIDFTEIDQLIETAKNNIHNGNFDQANDNINQIKRLILDITKTLHEHANQSKSDRLRLYVQKYLGQIKNKLDQLTDIEGIDVSLLEEAKLLFSELKESLSKKNIDESLKLLRNLSDLIKKLEKSIS